MWRGSSYIRYETPQDLQTTDITPLTGMSSAYAGGSQRDLHSDPESPNDQELPESDIDMSLASVWVTLSIRKLAITAALKERVIRHLDNALGHNPDINPTRAKYNKMARDMVMREGTRYVEKPCARSLGMASITSSHPSQIPERL
jgi:hypothetical protein